MTTESTLNKLFVMECDYIKNLCEAKIDHTKNMLPEEFHDIINRGYITGGFSSS